MSNYKICNTWWSWLFKWILNWKSILTELWYRQVRYFAIFKIMKMFSVFLNGHAEVLVKISYFVKKKKIWGFLINLWFQNLWNWFYFNIINKLCQTFSFHGRLLTLNHPYNNFGSTICCFLNCFKLIMQKIQHFKKIFIWKLLSLRKIRK